MGSYNGQELEMIMAFEGSIEYADSIKEAKAEIQHKTQHPSSADAATKIHRLEYELDIMEKKEANKQRS